MTGKIRLGAISAGADRLTGPPFGQLARGKEKRLDLRCGLLFRSIGYAVCRYGEWPFDEAKGVFPNTAGRIGRRAGLYAVGWTSVDRRESSATNRAMP